MGHAVIICKETEDFLSIKLHSETGIHISLLDALKYLDDNGMCVTKIVTNTGASAGVSWDTIGGLVYSKEFKILELVTEPFVKRRFEFK